MLVPSVSLLTRGTDTVLTENSPISDVGAQARTSFSQGLKETNLGKNRTTKYYEVNFSFF